MRFEKSLYFIILLTWISLALHAGENDLEQYLKRQVPLDEETLLFARDGEELWWAFHETLAGHPIQVRNNAFKAIHQWKMAYGLDGIPALSSALVYRACKMADDSEGQDQSEELLGLSLRLDPLIPDNYFTLAGIHFKNFHFINSISAFLNGCSASIRNISGRYYLLSNFLFLLVCTFFLVCSVFASILLLKYFPCLKHDFRELFLQTHSPEFITFFSWAFLFLPLLIGVGLVWTMTLWLVLFYKYMRRKEKVLALTLLISVCLVNPVLDMTLALYRDYPTSTIQSSLGMVRNGYNPVLISQIETLLEKSPQDLQSRFFLAHLYQEGGKYDTALIHYRSILKIDPSRYDIYLNIGNIYFFTDQNSWAIENYNRSIDINPAYAPAYYNASITYAREFNFEKAAEYKKEALRYDQNILDFAEKDRIFMNGPTPKMIYERILGEAKENFLNHFRPMTGKKDTREAGLLFSGKHSLIPGLVFLLLLLILSFVRRDRPYAVICSKCGTVYCRKCQSFTGPDAFCSQCHHLFIKRDGIAPQAKKIKMESIQNHRKKQRLQISLLTALFPGSTHFFLGFTFSGFLLVSIWASSIVYIIFENLLLENPLNAANGGISLITAVCVFLLVLIYLIANLRIHIRKL